MKKFLLSLLSVAALISVSAQDKKETKPAKKYDLTNRVADHLVIQYGFDRWRNTPDSVHVKNNSRHFNMYFMIDKPFRNSPKFSVAYGVGFGSSNIFFDKNYVNIKSTSTLLPFSRSVTNTDSGYYKKFKLTTIYLEAPIEVRYFSNPENPNKSWKAALGVKIGTLFKMYTKGKDLQTKSGQSVYGNKFVEKEVNKRYVNGTDFKISARFGYGIYGIHFDYQISQAFKEGLAPQVNPIAFGLSIGGL